MSWPDPSRREGGCLFAADEDNLEALLADDVLDGAAEPCPLVTQIVEVGFADQATQAPLFGGVRKQYVNLTRVEARQADDEITSDNQIGRHPPVVVRVTPARATNVRVRLTRTLNRGGFPAGSATLSATERGLAHLQWARHESTHTTDDNGQLLLEPGLEISALGGGEFKVEAALPGQGWVAGANSVQVMRRVYLRPVRRYAAGQSAAYGAISRMRSHLQTLGIEAKRVTSSTGSPMGVIESTALASGPEASVLRTLRSSTGHVRELRPHLAAVVIGEFASMDAVPLRTWTVDVARGSGGQFPASVDVLLETAAGDVFIFLPLDDGTGFGSCRLTGGGHTETINSPQVSGLTRFAKQLRVDISAVRGNFGSAATLELKLRVKCIDSWAVGWAYNDHPVIYLNMRDPNTDAILSSQQAQALMIHELGHKLHLAASGQAGQPDVQPHHYPTGHQGVNHVGPHCSHGVPSGTSLNTDAADTAADCTMWGALKTITTFCSECKTSLRKVDLGAGF